MCETLSDTVFVLKSSFTSKDNYFGVAIDEACEAFIKIMLDFEYTQKLEIYDPNTHQIHPPHLGFFTHWSSASHPLVYITSILLHRSSTSTGLQQVFSSLAWSLVTQTLAMFQTDQYFNLIQTEQYFNLICF